jgi:SET domain-containing protein
VLEVGKSPIHGRGCFAKEPREPGALIGRFEGTPTSEDGKHVLWLDDDVAIVVTNELRFLNHAADPNAEITAELELVALRAIAAGDEITIDYGPDWA